MKSFTLVSFISACLLTSKMIIKEPMVNIIISPEINVTYDLNVTKFKNEREMCNVVTK